MLVLLHEHFGKISGSKESFDDFLYWGEMLLNDFNDVDKYLVDARDLFRNVYDYRSLDDDLSHLSETQIDAIRRFWSHFMPVEGNKAKEKFQETWEVLLNSIPRLGKHLRRKDKRTRNDISRGCGTCYRGRTSRTCWG